MLNLVPLGTPYLFPADVCVPNSPIIEYGHRILSKPLLTTTDQKCFTSLLTDHKSILLHQDFQLKIPNSSFFYGLSSHSTFYSVSHRLSVDNDFWKKSNKRELFQQIAFNSPISATIFRRRGRNFWKKGKKGKKTEQSTQNTGYRRKQGKRKKCRKSLNALRNTQYAVRNTFYGRRLTEIFLEFVWRQTD